MLEHFTDPYKCAPERVAEVARVGLYGVEFLAGFAQRCFHRIKSAFEPVDAGGLPVDKRLGRGLLRLVPFAKEADYRPGDTRDTCDDADDDFSGHEAPPRFAPGRGQSSTTRKEP